MSQRSLQRWFQERLSVDTPVTVVQHSGEYDLLEVLTTSVTSSMTPGKDENSCDTPMIEYW